MPEKIIIEFDDKEQPEDKDENRIIIDFGDDESSDEKKASIEVENIEPRYEDKILKSGINSYFKGSPQLNNFFETELKFPEGIDQGFRKKFILNLKDEFFNSILENNKYIILSSKKGNVYFIDRFTGAVVEKVNLEKESFEKTGLVHENIVYINSLKGIHKFSPDGIKHGSEEIYNSPDNFFIWSSLNRRNETIVFTEFNTSESKAILKLVNLNDPVNLNDFTFDVKNFVSDKVCIADEFAFLLFDNNILVFNLDSKSGEVHNLNIEIDENSFIFYLNYRIYITSRTNELFYIDLPAVNYRFRTTGIKNTYINSIGGFKDNIFEGTLDGWKYYKSSGLQVYSYDDEYENKIECISKNILVISQGNKIVFCNLNRFQEAEGYVISPQERNEPVEIVSAVISNNEIFILTKNGILEVFTNDKLNIHI